MNERMQESLNKILEAVEDGVDLLGDEIPALAQEVILYGRVSTGLAILLFVVGVIAGICVFRRRNAYEDSDAAFGISVGMTAVSIVGLIVAGGEAIKPWVAPRLYLVDQLKGLL